MTAIAVTVLVFALISLLSGNAAATAILLGSAMVVQWFSRAHYRVVSNGLMVDVGYGWPRIRIAYDEIKTTECGTLSAFRVGGLGYRGNWTVLKRVAISLGGGTSVVVRTTDGRQLQLSSRRAFDLNRAIASITP